MKSYEVQVIGSGFGGNIASINIMVDFDPETETIENFFEKACSKSFQAGYNVLHLTEINGIRGTRCLWSAKECDKIGKKILGLVDDITLFTKWLKALKEAKETGEEVVIDENHTARLNTYTGEYQIGCWKEHRMEEEIRSYSQTLSGINIALEALGFDINDEATRKRILTNLGFYR